jgi:uncharacterized membrane protein YphA (DoxX/SURF4 family)
VLSYRRIASDIPIRSAMSSFTKNIAIIGGMLYVWTFGSGAFSVDARKSRKRDYLR